MFIFRRGMLLAAGMVSTVAWAQQGTVDAPKQAAQQLEASLLCKPGTKILAKTVESQFAALGLVKGMDVIYLPAPKAGKVMLFGGEVVAAMLSKEKGESSVAVYLQNQSGKSLAQRYGVNNINEWADTDEPSYVKQTSKKTALFVFSASSLDVQIGPQQWESLEYNAAIKCQVTE